MRTLVRLSGPTRRFCLTCFFDSLQNTSQGKVFEISNQDFAGLQEHAGHTVKLTGDLNADGKTIKVSEITMLGKSEKAHTEPKKEEKKY